MKKLLIIKVLYYLFFSVIFLIALIIFFEITNNSFYNKYLGDFLHKTVNIFNF
jgi:uncharacterized membrane protein